MALNYAEKGSVIRPLKQSGHIIYLWKKLF